MEVAARSGPARSRSAAASTGRPFGGYKESGIGREHSFIGFEEHLEAKTVAIPAG